ncbi:unnamed protein product [Rotaria socialis]|uniref:Uncharacterized protein n=1 Tax=Rotaria socialis TaxID=392032 RepID=A0A818TRZ8_9BILA|nr:unnamed protein product [Rotaria socialis]
MSGETIIIEENNLLNLSNDVRDASTSPNHGSSPESLSSSTSISPNRNQITTITGQLTELNKGITDMSHKMDQFLAVNSKVVEDMNGKIDKFLDSSGKVIEDMNGKIDKFLDASGKVIEDMNGKIDKFLDASGKVVETNDKLLKFNQKLVVWSNVVLSSFVSYFYFN